MTHTKSAASSACQLGKHVRQKPTGTDAVGRDAPDVAFSAAVAWAVGVTVIGAQVWIGALGLGLHRQPPVA